MQRPYRRARWRIPTRGRTTGGPLPLPPGEIDFTVDGVVTHVLKPGDLQSGWSSPFENYAERLFLDLQVGSWGGTVDNSTLPQSMLVDWVRVTQP